MFRHRAMVAAVGSASCAALVLAAKQRQQCQASSALDDDAVEWREQDVQYQMKRGDKRAWDGYITPETLAAWMRHDNKTGYAVVDVRDSDFATKRTGKQMVKGAVSISAREIRNNPSAVVERLQHNDTVVFHCMYSRQRGPGSAQIYAHERHRRHGAVGEDNPQHQNVFVLEGGFKRFYKTFGNSPDNADLFQPAHR